MKALGLAAVEAGKPKAVIVRAAIEMYLTGTLPKPEPWKTCPFYRAGFVLGCRFPLWRENLELYEPGCPDCRYETARIFYGPEKPPEKEVNDADDSSRKA